MSHDSVQLCQHCISEIPASTALNWTCHLIGHIKLVANSWDISNFCRCNSPFLRLQGLAIVARGIKMLAVDL